MRTKLFVPIIVVFVSALLFSCNRTSGPTARRLLIYTPHGQDLLRDFVARYKSEHKDVDVQFLDMGSREIHERVRAERNRPQLRKQSGEWLRYWDTEIRGKSQK